MKILICGSRGWTNPTPINDYIKKQKEEYGDDLIIVQGNADGVDTFAKLTCVMLGIEHNDYPITSMLRRFFKNGAGRVRNEEMYRTERPDRIVAFKHEGSPGTEHMIQIGKEHDTEVVVFYENDADSVNRSY